jgi:hypothetical protein
MKDNPNKSLMFTSIPMESDSIKYVALEKKQFMILQEKFGSASAKYEMKKSAISRIMGGN